MELLLLIKILIEVGHHGIPLLLLIYWRGIIKGPWIHQNIIETIKDINIPK